MNIFALDNSPEQAARWHFDKHCLKLQIEALQLLSSALILSGQPAPYKLAFQNHPCAIWTRASAENFDWVRSYGLAICAEYTFRYGRIHACAGLLRNLELPANLPQIPRTSFVQVVSESCKNPDPIAAYRAYYATKKTLATWSKREPPPWFPREAAQPPATILRKRSRREKEGF